MIILKVPKKRDPKPPHFLSMIGRPTGTVVAHNGAAWELVEIWAGDNMSREWQRTRNADEVACARLGWQVDAARYSTPPDNDALDERLELLEDRDGAPYPDEVQAVLREHGTWDADIEGPTLSGVHLVEALDALSDWHLANPQAASAIPALPVNGEGYPALGDADPGRLAEQLRSTAHHHGWADAMLMEKAAAALDAIAGGEDRG